MTAYSPRHALGTVPRAPQRPPLWRRMLALLPARTVTVPDPVPFADGCNDLPDGIVHVEGVLSDRMLAEVREQWNAARTPVWAVRRDGLVTVTAGGDVEVYPAPLAWQASTAPTGSQPVLDDEAAELARAEYVRARVPVMGERPQLEVLERTAAALRRPGDGERLAGAMLP